MWVWRRVLSVVIKPLLRGTGLRLVHQDYIDSEVYRAVLGSEREYRELEFAFLCECENLQAGAALSSWFIEEYGDSPTKARRQRKIK